MILSSLPTNATPCLVNKSIQTGSLTATSFNVNTVPNNYPLFAVTSTTTTVSNNLAVATGSTSPLQAATATTLTVGTATIGTLAGNAFTNLQANIAAKQDLFSVNTPLKFTSGVLSLDTTTLTNVPCSGTLQSTGALTVSGAATMQTTLAVTGLSTLAGATMSGATSLANVTCSGTSLV